MSAERIDHVQRALNTQTEAVAAFNRGEIDTANYMAVLAQSSATLALVEQQRIANLLSFAQFNHDLGDGGRVYTNLEGAAQWRLEAGEALGLS